MDKLTFSDILSLLSALGVAVSVATALSAVLSRNRAGAAADAELKSDVKHIRQMVEANSAALVHLGEKIDQVEVALAHTEESCKSAHKRIDGVCLSIPS